MSVIRNSQFKITTVWPELVNKRIQTVTLRLKESQFSKSNDLLSIKGLLSRDVCYFDYDGRNRKTEDQLQFEVIIDNAGEVTDFDILTVELRHDYFIFQPRRIADNQAIFEHGFSMIIHRRVKATVASEPSNSIVEIYTDFIVDRGRGTTIINGPILSGDAGLKPEITDCRVDFTDTATPFPVTAGVVRGIISYLNTYQARVETEFEQPFSLCLKLPRLTTFRQFMITGEISDGHWWFDSATFKWHLKLKLNYTWRIMEEKAMRCLSRAGSDPESHRVKLPLIIQKQCLQIPKIFQIPAGELTPHELVASKPQCSARLTKQGILLGFDFLIEIYAADNAGQEIYHCYPVSGDELINPKSDASIITDSPAGIIPVFTESQVKLVRFFQTGDYLQVETVIDLQLNLYQYHWLDLNATGNPNGYIFGPVFRGQETFIISGFQSLKLRARPVRIRDLNVSTIQARPQIKNNWIHLAGEFKLGVSYLDGKRCLREDTFPVFFQETFLWDALQPDDEVTLDCRLEHNSYAFNPGNPLQLEYHFQLVIKAESFRKGEVAVTVVPDPAPIISRTGTGANNIRRKSPNITDNIGHIPVTQLCNRQRPGFKLEGEIPLQLGKAREVAAGRFSVSHFNYQYTVEYILIEGYISGTIEYWDGDGYLRREQAGFSFWKCLRRGPDFVPGKNRLIPELNRFRYTPVNGLVWCKGRIKIQCILELRSSGEEGVL